MNGRRYDSELNQNAEFFMQIKIEPRHEISNNVVCVTSNTSDAQSDQSLCLSLDFCMSVKLLTEHHLEFLSLKGGYTGSSESTLVKMPHCWKSHVTAQMETAETSSDSHQLRPFSIWDLA